MEPTTVRCPRCRKRQAEPCPKRCGCGESLLDVLAARRAEASRQLSGTAGRAARSVDNPRVTVPLVGPAQPRAGASREPIDNEW